MIVIKIKNIIKFYNIYVFYYRTNKIICVYKNNSGKRTLTQENMYKTQF